MKFTIAAAAFALVSSATAASTSKPAYFKLTATKTNSGLLDKDLHANSGRFWVNRKTKSICPTTLGSECSKLNPKDTTFTTGAQGRVELHVADPGGQHVYIGGSGVVRFTEGHDGAVPSKADSKRIKSVLTSGARTWLCNESNEGVDKDKYFLVVAPSKDAKPNQSTAKNTCTRVKVVAKADQRAKPAFRFE